TGWAVGQDGVILATRNGGKAWQTHDIVTNQDLNSVHFANAHTGWIVGNSGVMLRADVPVYAPWAEMRESKESGGANNVDLFFFVQDAPPAGKVEVRANVSGKKERWFPLEEPLKKPESGDGLWQLAWNPSDYNIQSGKIDFAVQ